MLGCHNTSGLSSTHKGCVIMEKVQGGVARCFSQSEYQLVPVNKAGENCLEGTGQKTTGLIGILKTWKNPQFSYQMGSTEGYTSFYKTRRICSSG